MSLFPIQQNFCFQPRAPKCPFDELHHFATASAHSRDHGRSGIDRSSVTVGHFHLEPFTSSAQASSRGEELLAHSIARCFQEGQEPTEAGPGVPFRGVLFIPSFRAFAGHLCFPPTNGHRTCGGLLAQRSEGRWASGTAGAPPQDNLTKRSIPLDPATPIPLIQHNGRRGADAAHTCWTCAWSGVCWKNMQRGFEIQNGSPLRVRELVFVHVHVCVYVRGHFCKTVHQQRFG